MREQNLQSLIMMAVSGLRTTTIFRNNVGMGWIGRAKRIASPTTVKLMPGDIVIQNGRPLHAGLCEGSSDLVGWTETTITHDMVGKKVAIFTAIEVKTDAGRVSASQMNFISRIRQAGGIAGIARSPEEARKLIANP